MMYAVNSVSDVFKLELTHITLFPDFRRAPLSVSRAKLYDSYALVIY